MNHKKIFLLTLLSTTITVFFIIGLGVLVYYTVILKVNFYWYFFFLGNYLLNLFTSFYLLNAKRRINSVKLRWLFIINLLPVVGLLIFYIFGLIPFEIKNQQMIQKTNGYLNFFEDYTFTKHFLHKPQKNLDFCFIYNYTNAPVYQHNMIEIIHQNDLAKLSFALIQKAQKFIHIQFFIIADSLWFYFLLAELVKKVRNGVEVRLLYDWVGVLKRFSKFNLTYLKENGIKVRVFNPQGFNKYTSITNFRSHRKCLIVDNKYALIGGSNLSDEYLNLKKDYDNWRDLNFLLEGEIVNSLNLAFCNDWINYTKKKGAKKEVFAKKYFQIHKAKQQTICQLVQSSPEFDIFVYKALVLAKIANAKKRLWIYTPYLSLPEEIVEQLVLAAAKNVDVKLLLPHYPDDKNFILILNRSFYARFLAAKIKIYEYYGFLHAKAIIIDDDQVIIGTSNLDYRSFIINFETSILVFSRSFNFKMQHEFKMDLQNSLLINYANLNQKYKLKHKILGNFINIIQPLL